MKIEEIQDMFFQECVDGLSQAEEGLLALQAGTGDEETINTIFRAVHSIKGGSGAFAFSALQHFAHHFETLLDQVRSGERAVTRDLIATLLTAFDVLADHVAAARGEQPTPDDKATLDRLQATVAGTAVAEAAEAAPEPADDLGFDLDAMIGDLELDMGPVQDWEEAKGEEAAAPEPSAAGLRLTLRPLDNALGNGSEPLLLIRELVDLGGTIEAVDWSELPDLFGYEPNRAYLTWHMLLPHSVPRGDVEDIFEFVSDCCRLDYGEGTAVSAASEAPAPPPNTDAVTASDVPDLGPATAEPVAVETAVAPAKVDQVVPAPPAAMSSEEPLAVASAAPAAAPVPADEADGAGDGGRGGQQQASGITPTIRVDLEKLDRLVNLVGELVITQSMLAQRLLDCGLSQITELNDLDHLTRELQDSAMSIRAQPIRSVFGRVPRIVRELQASTGKRVNLEIEGESTELDKTVVERIGEPLTHLIRNAIDHGLETPEERLAAGKSEFGRVRLSAEHRSGKILISVTDDGRGINRERVLAKAVERGIVGADARLSNEEIDNLIFAPGFSTAETVSNISGRGVGMDVVRRNITALGGRISISSRAGEGSTFTMALPLTLAILDGMIVRIGEQTLVVPLNHIVETLRPQEDTVKSFGVGQRMLNVRGEWLPIMSVGRALSIPGAEADPTSAVLIVVDGEATGRGVLMVDEIVDQRQVVIKSLETNFGNVRGVAGATILGNGRVALILDVEAVTSVVHTAMPADMTRSRAA